MLFTIRSYVNNHILRSIYFAIFDSHINYANLIWDRNLNTVIRILILQKKALGIIMNFQTIESHSCLLSKSNHILKLKDRILIENILSINKSSNNLLPSILESWFTFCSDVRNYRYHFLKYLNYHKELILTEKIQSL